MKKRSLFKISTIIISQIPIFKESQGAATVRQNLLETAKLLILGKPLNSIFDISVPSCVFKELGFGILCSVNSLTLIF